MATTYGSTTCDGSGTFTGLNTGGDGLVGFDSSNQQEGVACLYTEMNGTAGYAYAYLDLSTPIGNGDYFHIGGWLWFARDWDFETPHSEHIEGSTSVPAIELYSTGSIKQIRLMCRPSQPAPSRHYWLIHSNIGNNIDIFDAGWHYGAWYYIDIYGYVDNTAGWVQVWENGIKRAEIAGIDTYSGSDWDRLILGASYENSAGTDICFVFDDFVVNDDASPSPPAGYGGTYGSPGNHNIIAPFYHDGRHCRGVVNSHWPTVLEWKH